MTHNPYAPPKSIEVQKNGNFYPVKKVIISINISTFVVMYLLLLQVRFETISNNFSNHNLDNIFYDLITILLLDFLVLCLPNLFTCFLVVFKKYYRGANNIVKIFFACSLLSSLSAINFFLFIEMVINNKFTSFQNFLTSHLSLIIVSSIGYGLIFSFVSIFCLPKYRKE